MKLFPWNIFRTSFNIPLKDLKTAKTNSRSNKVICLYHFEEVQYSFDPDQLNSRKWPIGFQKADQFISARWPNRLQKFDQLSPKIWPIRLKYLTNFFGKVTNWEWKYCSVKCAKLVFIQNSYLISKMNIYKILETTKINKLQAPHILEESVSFLKNFFVLTWSWQRTRDFQLD